MCTEQLELVELQVLLWHIYECLKIYLFNNLIYM